MIERIHIAIKEAETLRQIGYVSRVIGLVIECEGLVAPIGSLCVIKGSQTYKAEVVGFKDETILLMALSETEGIKYLDQVELLTTTQKIPVSQNLLGRVIDSLGRPLDGGPAISAMDYYPIYRSSPSPLDRMRPKDVLTTGIRSIDSLLTCAKGQRMGLFAGSGVGKSVLLGMIARNTHAQVNVVSLVGERGREVKDFIERDLKEEGLKRSVVVVETSDRPALLRSKAPFTATAIAEYFRDKGKDVMLLMDSITRMSNAQREIGLSAGEPPATKGYTPSVFSIMPKLLERAGQTEHGSITGIYTILVEGDDMNEPIADTARSILDGHIWLSRELAQRGHYPSVDPLTSISRLMIDVVSSEHMKSANAIRAIMSVYKQSEDMINIGAYVTGSNPQIDSAIKLMPQINNFLRQGITDKEEFSEMQKELIRLAKDYDMSLEK